MPEPFHGSVQAVLEIDERIAWPELVSELISRDQFARSFEQHDKNLNWLTLHLNFASMLAQLTRPEIEFETLEFDRTRSWFWLAHTPSPSHVRSRRGPYREHCPSFGHSMGSRFYHPDPRASITGYGLTR